jgi:hypothetical protein
MLELVIPCFKPQRSKGMLENICSGKMMAAESLDQLLNFGAVLGSIC